MRHQNRHRRPAATSSDQTERDWMNEVTMTARSLGYLVYHTHDSRRSEPGFPDCILIRGKYLLAIELKRSRLHKPTAEQTRWLKAFSGVSHVRAAVWKPEDRYTIIEHLAAFANDAYVRESPGEMDATTRRHHGPADRPSAGIRSTDHRPATAKGAGADESP